MAGRGPAPKPAHQRRRRNAEAPVEQLPADGYQGAYPPLPAKWRDERKVSRTDEDGVTTTSVKVVQIAYLKATRGWYDTWARSPMAAKFTQVEWNRLLLLAPLVDQYHRRPSKEIAGELRLQETLLGATLMDRQRARLAIAPTDTDGSLEQRPVAQVRRLRAVDPAAAAG